MNHPFKLVLGAAAILAAFGVCAQTYPAAGKTITIVVPFTAGGPTDRVARDLATPFRGVRSSRYSADRRGSGSATSRSTPPAWPPGGRSCG